jgi:flagellin
VNANETFDVGKDKWRVSHKHETSKKVSHKERSFMGMRITTNVASLNAQKVMVTNTREMQKSMAQLSTGSRITKAGDDAAGLAISEQLKSQIRSYGQANRNANDGISMIQTAEQSMGEVSNIVTRLRELGVQAASDTIGDQERGFINKEVEALKSEIQRVAESASFGSRKLLDGTGGTYDIHIGTGANEATDWITYDASQTDVTVGTLGIADLDFSSKETARSGLQALDTAQSNISGSLATLGAMKNRLSSNSDVIGTMVENMSAANSRIRDTDVAASSSELARNNVLLQGTTATLAQANQLPQMALKLLG